MGGFHYWKGGDDDPRDQVGVDPTTPAAGDAEPVHPVWGYPFPGAGPPDLDHAIQVATDAFDGELQERSLDAPDIIRIAVEAAAPVLLQAMRDRLADLEDDNAILRRVAKHAEWIGPTRSTSHCPVCAGWKEQGHTPGCRLAAALDGPAAQEEDGGG